MRLSTIARLLGSVLLLASGVQAQNWSAARSLGGGSTPDLDIDPATGRLFVVHHNANTTYTLLDANLGTVLQESISAAAGDNRGGFQFGATIAYDPTTGQPHVCYRINTSSDLYDVYYIRRQSNGSWTSPLRIVNGVRRAYSVRMDIDSQGVAHIVHGTAEGTDVFGPARYVRIANGSVNRTITGLNSYRADDRVELAVGSNNAIHIILSRPDDNASGGPITYHRSTNGGESLSNLGSIHSSSARSRNGNADVYADNAGNVHFVYGSRQDQSRGNSGSVRYARFEGGSKVVDVPVTDSGEIESWHHGLGVGSVAASDDGKNVVVAYNTGDGRSLRTRFSTDGGRSWSAPTGVASQSGGSEGRDKHVIRARGNTFYLVYPSGGSVFARSATLQGGPPPQEAPIARAGGPYSGKEGSPIEFDASASSDADGQIVQYRWDFNNDGSWDVTTSNAKVSYTYADDYNGVARLEVTDNDGLSGTAQAQVTVENVPPTVSAGGPYAAEVDQTITLSATVSDPGTNDTHTFAWDLNNDGNFNVNGKEVEAKFTTPGEKTVRVRATDKDGGTGTASATVTVTVGKRPPVANAGGPYTGKEGSAIEFDASGSSDPDGQIVEYKWDFNNDGTWDVTTSNAKVSYTYVDDYSGVAKLQVTDNDGQNATAEAQVTVDNVPPTVSAGGPYSTEINVAVTLTATVSDPGTNDTHTFEWDLNNDGTFETAGKEVQATFTTTGEKTVQVRATDKDGGVGTATTTVNVSSANQPPIANAGGPYTGKEGSPIEFDASGSSDPDGQIAEYKWDFNNDGTWDVTVATAKTSYTFADDYQGTVTLEVVDNRGAATQAQTQVTVENVPPSVNAGGPYETIAGGTVTLIATVSDPGVNDTHTISWDTNNDGVFEITGNNVNVKFNDPGNFTINVRAVDNNGGAGTASTTVEVSSGRPVVSQIPDQTINEGESFSPINLNNYVSDPDHAPEEIAWSVFGNVNILVNISNNIATLSVPNQDWGGTEQISFVATDPVGNSDTTTASFTLIIANRAPQIAPIPEQFTIRGMSFAPLNFADYVSDLNDPVESLRLSLTGTSVLFVSINGLVVSVMPPDNQWVGSDVLTFEVSDPAGAKATTTVKFTVQASTSVESDNSRTPDAFALHPNYPNPFNPQTRIAFDLKQSGHAVLTVFALDGRALASLVDRQLSAGTHSVIWDAGSLPSGTYFVELRVSSSGAESFVARRKMLLVR